MGNTNDEATKEIGMNTWREGHTIPPVAVMEQKGHYSSGPFHGYKSDVWEGGHRVPFIVRWPGQVQPGSNCSLLAHQADLIATIAEILNTTLPANAGEDSFSLLPPAAGKR